jgi:hypothetical protein
MKSGIYCIENTINGKKYIGRGTIFSEERKRKMSEAKKGKPWSKARREAYERRYGCVP